MPDIERHITDIRGPHEWAAYDGRTDAAELRAKRLDAAAKAAFNNLRAYSNCCRSTLWALQTHLDLQGDRALRATTALAGGIAGTGETCGAVLGALMALGLSTESPGESRQLAAAFVERFTERYDGTRCYAVQKATIGWCCDDPSLTEKWIAVGGPIACAAVCAEAARIAGALILDARAPATRTLSHLATVDRRPDA